MRPLGILCAHRGMSILELLVALVLFSIGVMGIASLQANGLKYASTADNRSQASLLASDLIDRVRANKPNFTDYKLALGVKPSRKNLHPIAQADLEQWHGRVSQYLPSGQGEVSLDGRRITVRLVWIDRAPHADTGFLQSQLSVSADI